MQVMSVIHMARRYGVRPSECLQIQNDYDAYCFDEACCYIWDCLEEEKRPFFYDGNVSSGASVNDQTVCMLQNLGAEVRNI